MSQIAQDPKPEVKVTLGHAAPVARVDDGRDQLSDHEYDGIREYDNPTPGWWVLLFIVSVVFSGFYFLYYHMSGQEGTTLKEAYESAKTEDFKARFAGMGKLERDAASLVKYMNNPEYVSVGQSIFKANCVSCHGSEAQGMVGPNLTDDYFKWVKKIEDIPDVITNGRANGAMPAWGSNKLESNEVVLVSAYVASIRGQNKLGPRGTEGDKIAPWPTAATTAPAATAPTENTAK